MPSTPTPGSDPAALPATFGGAGWRVREASHAEDVAAGRLWRRAGVAAEWAPLREVTLAVPGPEVDYPEHPDRWLMLARPDAARLRRQAEAVAAFYERQGVIAHRIRPAAPPPPNFLFQRDLYLMTPEGAILARPAPPQRAAEARPMAAALAGLGVPLLMPPRGGALFEGADALWLSPREVLVGVGVRTNAAAFEAIAGLLGGMGVVAEAVAMPAATQHLLGVVNVIDADLAAVHGGRLTPSIRDALTRRAAAPDPPPRTERAGALAPRGRSR